MSVVQSGVEGVVRLYDRLTQPTAAFVAHGRDAPTVCNDPALVWYPVGAVVGWLASLEQFPPRLPLRGSATGFLGSADVWPAMTRDDRGPTRGAYHLN